VPAVPPFPQSPTAAVPEQQPPPTLPSLLRAATSAALLGLAAAAPAPALAQILPRLQLPDADAPRGPAIARFALPAGAPATLAPLMQRVADTARLRDASDIDDDERQLRRLRDRALEVLATEGYFEPEISVAEGDERARYVLQVTLGPRATISRVELDFRGPISAQPERVALLRRSWDLQSGQPFRDAQWSTAKTRLLSSVQDRDFPTATIVESAAEVDVETASVRLLVVVDSGPAFTLGPLQVSGLERYERTLVQRFIDFQQGDPYDRTRLLDFQRRLQAGPFFSSVEVEVQLDRDKPEQAPVLVRVREAPSKRVSAGIGFSTNVGARTEAVYRQVGLLGRPYTLQTGLGLDKTRQIGFADVLLPPKPDGARDSFGILGEHTDIENLITTRYAAAVAREYTFNRDEAVFDTRLSLTAQRESQRVDDEADEEAEEEVNTTLSLAYQWTRRRVDSITNPRTGSVLTLRGAGGIGRAGIGELLERSFAHGYVRYVLYVPAFARDQIILRAEAGHVIADDINFVPTDYRFRTGGSGSIRGYQYESLGTPVFDEDGRQTAVLPARSLLAASAEYVRWFNDTWGMAAFYDIGDAFDKRPNELAGGYGLGVRYRTIAGPLALDAAYGDRDRRWRLHFSIAISF
jgi:translocation and assembly module TamA